MRRKTGPTLSFATMVWQRAWVSALLLTFMCLNPASAQTASPSKPRVEKTQLDPMAVKLQFQLDEIVAREKFPGATLAVALKDGRLIELASGYADTETATKLTVNSRMFCGSTGKTFVSAVALKLVEDGKLDLDAKASQYFLNEDQAWFAKLPNADTMTVRSLMNHTSGLPRYLFQPDYLADLKANPFKSRTPREGLEALHGTKPMHEVEKGWAYSDSNYLVLGLIIEKVSGRKYYDLANQWLILPLKLTQTIPTTQPKLKGLVQGHIGSMNLFDLPKKTVVNGEYVMNPEFEWCGGGYVTTTGDLARWLHALHSGQVLSKKMHQQLITHVSFISGQPASSSEGGYGLGSFVWPSEAGQYYGHAGIMPGYLTQIEYSADHGFAIAFQTNTDEGLGHKHHGIVQEIAATVIGFE